MAENDFDVLSYALGLSMGNNFRSSGVDKIDVASFADGVAAVYAGAKPKMTYAEAKNVINQFFTELQAKQQASAAQMAQVNAEAGRKFLEQNAKRPEVQTTPSGLQYEVLQNAEGAKASKTDTVVVHYTGRLIDGTVFDSSEERGEPATFGVTQVIPGWVEALQIMPNGAKWRLYIPSELAYGGQNVPGIGPNQTLIFDVTLLEIKGK